MFSKLIPAQTLSGPVCQKEFPNYQVQNAHSEFAKPTHGKTNPVKFQRNGHPLFPGNFKAAQTTVVNNNDLESLPLNQKKWIQRPKNE